MNRRPPQPPPWWTAADQAEVDVLVHEFVRGVFDHRERCSVCREGGPWCDPVRRALDAVLEFRRGRRLLSAARWLRAHEDLAEFEEKLGV